MSKLPTRQEVLAAASELPAESLPEILALVPAIEKKVLRAGPKMKKHAPKLRLIVRLLTEAGEGAWTETPWHRLACAAVAVRYFTVADDSIPDSVPVVGLSDDLEVLLHAWEVLLPDLKEFARERGLRASEYFDINEED